MKEERYKEGWFARVGNESIVKKRPAWEQVSLSGWKRHLVDPRVRVERKLFLL